MKRLYRILALLTLLIAGGSLAASAANTYYFECGHDVLQFIGISGVTAVYSDGAYTVSPIPSDNRYAYLSVSVREEYQSQYTLTKVSCADGSVDIYDGVASIPVYYFPGSVNWTVEFDEGGGQQTRKGWTFKGPEGLQFTYSYNNNIYYPYADGEYVIDDLQPYDSRLTVRVGSDYTKIFRITDIVEDATGATYRPDAAGTVTVPVDHSDYSQQKTFTVNTAPVQAGQEISFTATLVNGAWTEAFLYVAGVEYDFYDGARTVTAFADNDELFITGGLNGRMPYRVTVDGKTLPATLWDLNTTYDVEGFTIAPGSQYYPANGGRLDIYMDNPDQSGCNVTFTFVNPGTEGFLSDLQTGFTYIRGEELEDAIANGLNLKSGTDLTLGFNLIDFTVGSISVNGSVISRYQDGYSVTVSEDLDFIFNVTANKGNIVHFNVPSCYEGVLVYDRNDASTPYTLPSGNCDIEFRKVVEEIKIVPAEGYEMSQEATSVPVTVTAGGQTESYFAGSFFSVVDGMTVDVAISKTVDPSEKTFTIYCSADVLEFSGVQQDGTPGSPVAVYTAGQGGESGYYTVTSIPFSLYGAVREQFRDEYKIQYVDYQGELAYCPDGINFSIPASRVGTTAVFTVVFQAEAAPARYVTIEVSNPGCIKRIYNGNSGNITAFPAQYDLNDGLSLTIEMAADGELYSVTCGGRSLLTAYDGETATISLEGVEEGDIIYVSAGVAIADIIYTFEGPEGLSISYNGISAEYGENGKYLIENVHFDSLNQYPVVVSVAPGYENRLILLNVTYGDKKWEPAGTTGIINIPGADLPDEDVTFTVNTRVPDPSETVRQITLTIDNVDAVNYGHYMGGSSQYFSFNAEGSVQLTITPQQYEIQLVTNKAVTHILTDVEGTFMMPDLPSTRIVLNLSNAVDGQTIEFITNGTNAVGSLAGEEGDAEVYTLQGVRVADPTNLAPGLYIVSGRLVMVK